MIDWQPIRTAPRDGTVVLLYPTGWHHEIAAGYLRTWVGRDWVKVNETTKKYQKTPKQSEWCYHRTQLRTTYQPEYWAPLTDLTGKARVYG
jgi:hypothetical protein